MALDLVVGFQTSDNPLLIDTLGWVQYRLGTITQAILFLKQAVVLSPANPELNYHLGMAYLADEQIKKARTHFTKALSGEETAYYSARVREVLADLPSEEEGI